MIWTEGKLGMHNNRIFFLLQLLIFWWIKRLFEAEEQDLFQDLQSLPRNAALRKLNDLIKRARLAKVKWMRLEKY